MAEDAVRADRQQDNQTGYDASPERVDVEEDEPAGDCGDDQGTDGRAGDGAGAAADRGATDDRGCDHLPLEALDGVELQVIAAAIIGGTAVSGGTGSVPGAAIGALIVAAITSGLVFFNVDPLWGSVVTGLVILLAIGSDGILRHRLSGPIGRRRRASSE